MIIKYNRGKTSMQIQNLRNRKRFSNSNRDLSQSSVCYNHILSCGYFSCEDKRKKTNWNYKEIYRNKLLSCESWILKKWLCSWLSLITFSRYNACNLTVLNHGGSFSSHQLFNNLESAIRISPLFAKMRTNHVKLILNFETSVPRKTRRKKNAFFPWQLWFKFLIYPGRVQNFSPPPVRKTVKCLCVTQPGRGGMLKLLKEWNFFM